MPSKRDESGRFLSKEDSEKLRVKEFLRLAHKRFKLAADAEQKTRAEALDDVKFSVGQQWSAQIKAARELESVPCLTINRLPQFIHQVTAEQRQQKPSAQINPVGDGADQETAEILQGIIRHIDVNSDADIARDHAFDCMLRGRIGFYRLCADYADDESFEQEIKVEWIKNQFAVYLDPDAKKPDKSDANWGFIICDYDPDEFKDQYPDSALASLSDWSSIGDNAPGWWTPTNIRVAEYYWVETSYSDVKSKGGKTRKQRKRKIHWSKINAVEEMESTEIPGSIIPIIEVVGDDVEIDGERHLAGLVTHAKDPQRQYNYMRSELVAAIAFTPKNQYLVAEGQIEGHEEEWRQANRKRFAVKTYKTMDVGGKPVPPPIPEEKKPDIEALTVATQQAAEELQATIGLNDANLGKTDREESGRKFLARQKQGDLSTFNYGDNLARSILKETRIKLDWIPVYYDTPRIQRIINPDGSSKHVIIHNGPEQLPEAQALQTEAIKKIYDISRGRYDVTVSVGPSYQTRRQEAAASMIEFLKMVPPQVAQNLLDLVAANFDWPGHQEFVARLRKMLPPNLLDQDGTDPKQMVTMLQAQLQKLGEQHELLVKANNDLTETLKTKQVEAQNKLEIAKLQAETQITVAEVNTKAQNLSERMKFIEDAIHKLMDESHEFGMQADQQAHEKDTLAKQAEIASAQSAQDAGQQSVLQDQANQNQPTE